MGTYDDMLPLQPPVRLPPDDELADAVRATPLAAEILRRDAAGDPRANAEMAAALRDGTAERTLQTWSEVCRALLAPEEALLLEVVRLFLGTEPAEGDSPDVLASLGLVNAKGPYELTPLGRWIGRQVLAEAAGQEVPVMGSLAERDAAELLHGLRSYPQAERDEELAGWLAGREPARAAAEIAAVLGEASPLGRAVGVELLATRLGEEGREALDGLLDEPRVGAGIAARLDREGHDPAPEDIAWVLVDMAAALLEFGGETSEVIESVANGMDADEQAGTLALLALCDHPGTELVLRVFIEHHPDSRVSAAARKALRRLHGLADARR
ncbi:hypothetical protein [Nonomuraea sp. LPB2021202275-12-8]|uniref:hypothetical protein n=1 Tax=Nonomuraea sp. LPB2021202275-12-8 TaxID=3120159 RepID=UPI00300C772B